MSPESPPPNPFARGDLLAQTGAEAAAFDTRAIERTGVPQAVLMENAGRSAALVIQAVYAPRRVVGVVGAGNNGGDALVVLRSLAAWGAEVRAVIAADRPADDPLLHGWPVETTSDRDLDTAGWASLLDRADVVVDGLLGTGVRGAPRERQASAIEQVNRSSASVVALDVPSGADATSGAVPGVAVEAALTISFGAPKTGALLHPARGLVGRHVTVEIGFPPMTEADATARVVTPAWAQAHLPVRETDTHKNRVGRVLVVGGAPGMAGAVILAARAAFHGGAGLVQVCSVETNRDSVQAAIPEAIFISWDDADALEAAVAETSAVVVGPGMGTGAPSAELLRRVVALGGAPVVLDADALNLASTGAVSLSDVSARRPVLITPHPGEMGRLAPDRMDGGSPLAIARAVAADHSVSVLLKGAPSVVAPPDGLALIDTQGSSDLAVAGMGDSLSGVCGALLAQGVEPHIAGALGLYLSGRAAVMAARGAGLTPSAVSDHLPAALVERVPARTDLPLPFVLFDAEAAR